MLDNLFELLPRGVECRMRQYLLRDWYLAIFTAWRIACEAKNCGLIITKGSVCVVILAIQGKLCDCMDQGLLCAVGALHVRNVRGALIAA